MKKYFVGMMAVAFAIATFAFTTSNTKKLDCSTQQTYWFLVKTSSGCIEQPGDIVITSDLVLPPDQGGNQTLDNEVFLGNQSDALSHFSACSGSGCICAVGYTGTPTYSSSLQAFVPQGSILCTIEKNP